MENIQDLSDIVFKVHSFFKGYAQRHLNNSLTYRNWLIGHYLVEYEQEGEDRAQYGKNTLKEVSKRMKKIGEKGFSERNLHLCRQFYLEYPQISQLLTAKFQSSKNQLIQISQLKTAKLVAVSESEQLVPVDMVIDQLSFTHIIELLKIKDKLQRGFYELQAIKNQWTVEQLKRNMGSMLYERVGLSTNKEEMLAKLKDEKLQQFSDVVKNPYLLEFLGIPEKAEYTETDLESAIITHLQQFLMEMGRGFCFEARQKRITFNNRHYRIDLVFYHRILKCHVLIDLKMGEFDHADAGQINMYLNYYKENEMSEGDNPPVGIVLCSLKDEGLVHYATGNLPYEVFVSQYMIQLPAEEELKQIILQEARKYEK